MKREMLFMSSDNGNQLSRILSETEKLKAVYKKLTNEYV